MAENMQKIKLLKLYEFLRKETDEDHPISRVALCKKLNEMGISSNVRTLSLDIETLTSNGYEVMSFLRDKEKFYYIPERELTVPEIKILLDAVQAASFVTEKKTAELVEKVAALGGSHRAELLKENMVCFNTRKHTNEAILYTVDSIEDAIIRKKKIAFNYFHLNENAEREYVTTATGNKKRYYIEPVALIFNEDNYYLMGYSKRHPGTTASYRIDRMDHVEVVEESVLSDEAVAMIDTVADFTEQAFKMFGGEMVDVELQFDKALIGPVFDKFGEDTPLMPIDDNTCAAMVHVRISPTFFGWLAQFAGTMTILSPDNAERDYGVWKSSEYIEKIAPFLDGAKHVLRDDGFIVINVKANREKPTGAASSRRSLVIEELALRMESEWGFFCVDIEIWVKGNPAPTGLRCACQDAYEQNLWFSVSPKWHINLDAIRRPYVQHSMDLYGDYEYKPRRNGLSYVRKNKVIAANPLGALPNNVITGGVAQSRSGHQAVQPLYLPEKYIKAVTDVGDLVIDPWVGSGTTGIAAIRLGRRFVGFDISDQFVALSEERIADELRSGGG